MPSGLSIDSVTGEIAGTVDTVETAQVEVTVSDGVLSTTTTFAWVVSEVPNTNTAPVVVAIADQSSTVGEGVSVPVVASDAEGDVLEYSATGLPSGVSISLATGLISGTVDTAETAQVEVTVSDGVLSTTTTFAWVVSDCLLYTSPSPRDS